MWQLYLVADRVTLVLVASLYQGLVQSPSKVSRSLVSDILQ